MLCLYSGRTNLSLYKHWFNVGRFKALPTNIILGLLRLVWPKLGDFCPLGYFWKLLVIYLKDEVAQRNVTFWATFCLTKFFSICILISCFKIWLYWRYFKVSKVIWCRCFGHYFWILWLGNCFGYFSKNWLFSNLLVTLYTANLGCIIVNLLILKSPCGAQHSWKPYHGTPPTMCVKFFIGFVGKVIIYFSLLIKFHISWWVASSDKYILARYFLSIYLSLLATHHEMWNLINNEK